MDADTLWTLQQQGSLAHIEVHLAHLSVAAQLAQAQQGEHLAAYQVALLASSAELLEPAGCSELQHWQLDPAAAAVQSSVVLREGCGSRSVRMHLCQGMMTVCTAP